MAKSYMIEHPYLPVLPHHPRPLSAPEPANDLPEKGYWTAGSVQEQAWFDISCATYLPKSSGHDIDTPAEMWWACEYPERPTVDGTTCFFAGCDPCYMAMLAYMQLKQSDGCLTGESPDSMQWRRDADAIVSFENYRLMAHQWVWRNGRMMVPNDPLT